MATPIFKFALAALAWSAALSHANDNERLNRYSMRLLTADANQTDLLSSVIQTELPSSIDTVGEAVDFILVRSGFRHIPTDSFKNSLLLPLPAAHRVIGPVDIRTALTTIAGQPWRLHENNHHRVVWFQLAGAPMDDSHIEKYSTTPRLTADYDSTELVGLSESTSNQKRIFPTEWTLDISKTLRQNLKMWSELANWTFQWNSNHDYSITHEATFLGSLQEAVGAALQHYRNAPVPLIAKFYAGNSVLVIEAHPSPTALQND